jgi:hypothetical protein
MNLHILAWLLEGHDAVHAWHIRQLHRAIDA